MKKIYLCLVLVLVVSLGVYSTYAQSNLEGRQLTFMCEKIQAYERECGHESPAQCNAANKTVINDFLNVCFFNTTVNSLACIKRINWLYADMFTNTQTEPCKTSLGHVAE